MSTKIIAAVSLALLLSATGAAIAQKEFKKQKSLPQSIAICKQVGEYVNGARIWHRVKCQYTLCYCSARECKKANESAPTYSNIRCQFVAT